MAGYQPSASTPTSSKSPLGKSLHDSSLLSRSGLDDTLHSTQSLSGRASIMTYNNTQYPSASAALAAYISDFEDANPLSLTYHRTVEDLFTPRSVMLRTVDRSLETGVRDTRDEWRRYTSKKLLDESFSEMVQADVEREKAESMMESSRLLTADLSPLPGSSVITEVESGASLSTDLLLRAPLYPTLTQPPSQMPEEAVPEWNPRESGRAKDSFRREFEQRFGGPSHENQSIKGRTQDSSIRSRVRWIERSPGSWVNISPVKKPVSGAVGKALKSGQSLPKQIPGKADEKKLSTSNLGLSKHDVHIRNRSLGNENVAPAYASKTDGGRRPPSWIQDLDLTGASSLVSQARLGGRAPPSWIQDLDKSGLSGIAAHTGNSGRAPPSWVQDLDVSGISSTVRSKSLMRGEGGRAPPSWIQDLNSTTTSEKLSNFRSLKSTENTLPASRTLMRTNSADNLLSEVHRGKGKSVEFGTNPRPKKASSFTTDDLINASPTGKGFHPPSHNSRGQYSTQETNSYNIPSQFNSNSYTLNGTAFPDERLASNSIKTSSIRKDPRFLNLQTETSQRGSLRSTRGTSSLKVSSLRTGHAASLASTPKRSVAFEATPARRSLNGYLVEGGLGSQSTRGGQLSHTRQTQRTQVEDDRQREDALLLRAQKVLDDARASKSQPSSSHHYHGNTDRHDNSLLTDEVLDGDRSWEKNLPSLKPLKSVQAADEHDADHHQDIVAKFLDDCLRSVDENQKLTGGLQPGPVEALKNMLFTLQGMAPSSQVSSPAKGATAPTNEAGEVVSSIRSSSSWSPQSGSKDTSRGKSFLKYTRRDTGSSGSGTDFEEAPGGKSLQRAMEHLTRLKCLVNGGSHPNTQPSSANGQVMSS